MAFFSQPQKPSEVVNVSEDVEKRDSLGRSSSGAKSLVKNTSTDNSQDPFAGEVEDGDINFKSLAWWQAGMVMIAETISLGILSLPSVLATVGLIPGILLIIGLGVMATYTGYVIGQFKVAYPGVHSMADAGEILFKPLGMPRFGKEFLGAGSIIFLIFCMASHVLTWTIMLNTLTNSATCTIVWSVIGAILFWIFDLPRTLKNMSWFSIASFISICTAVLITMIDVGVERPGYNTIHLTETVKFQTAFLSVANIMFAYAGHVAFFGFISEMEKPEDFPKALALLQITDTTMYVIVALVVYRYAGVDVKSPALGSAGPIVKKVAWGIAIPTIVIAGVIYGHVAGKYIFVRMFRGTPHLTKRTWKAAGTWLVVTAALWAVAWVIAESIPDFNDLLALISALFASHFTYSMSAIFWLFMNYGLYGSGWKKMVLTAVNVFILAVGMASCGLGLYTSIVAIHAGASGGGSWTCRSNAQ